MRLTARARIADGFSGAVSAPPGFGFFPARVRIVPAGLKQVLAFRAGIAVVVFVPFEVGTGKCAIFTLGFVDQWDEGNDAALLCQPRQVLRRSILASRQRL